eukprot:gnl/TRDRNA2_/TRDRNA2_168798_c0_seq8.p1 gnl/TRDRNA2_/TRDRNA2_168798_c0~~gnl/TRDRNA2_/TRDRNA2_168798_c0_seq8.p1  ORF type:complete len:766 (-),score=163.14 gnl/TRDRNA2_/TRDRNA2_168798_c0_seq8:128-2425(-)
MPSTDGETTQGAGGYLLNIDDTEVENINIKMFSSTEHSVRKAFLPEKDLPLELIFFRQIFNHLRVQLKLDVDSDENIPIVAFQRVMGRLFLVLGDSEEFNACDYDDNGNGFVGWGEFSYVFKKRRINISVSIFERIYMTFDNPDTSVLANLISMIVLATIMTSSTCFVLSTVAECQNHFDDLPPKEKEVFQLIEKVCLVIFCIEYFSKLFCVGFVRAELFNKPKLLKLSIGYDPIRLPSSVERIVRFVVNPANLIDLLAIAPAIISLFIDTGGGAFVVLRLVRLTRIFRAFRSPAFLEPVIVIGRTLQQSMKALAVLTFNLTLGIVIFGSLMWVAEGGEWDPKTHTYLRFEGRSYDAENKMWVRNMSESPFKSIPHAFWWAIVTATTVGYGDHYPTTSLGYVFAVLSMLYSIVIGALPIGIIGGTFSKTWEDFIEEKQKEREALKREMVFIARAVQKIEPARMARLVLIQVWNDTGKLESGRGEAFSEIEDQSKPHQAEFMGEVKVELQMPPDKPFVEEKVLKLKDSPETVKRKVTGTITIQYEWTPGKDANSGKAAPPAKTSKSTMPSDDYTLPVGTLKVTLIQGDGLINLDWSKKAGKSSPFCCVTAYINSPANAEDQLKPAVWRSPTFESSLDPKWQVSHTFEYRWSKTDGPSEGDNSSPKRMSNNVMSPAADAESSPNTQIDSKVNALFTIARDLAVEVKGFREELSKLSSRVNTLSVENVGQFNEAAASSVRAGDKDAEKPAFEAVPEPPVTLPGASPEQ